MAETEQAQPLLTQPELDLLAVHLLRSPQVINAALDKLAPEHLHTPMEFHYSVLWAVSSNYYRKYKTPIPQPVLRADLAALLMTDADYQIYAGNINAVVEIAFAIPESDLAPDVVIANYLQRLLNVKVFQAAVSELGTDATPDKMFEVVRTAYTASRLSSVSATPMFRVTEEDMSQALAPAVVSGSQLFDYVTDGGIRPRHMTIGLAPSGGGKTSLQLETAVQCAKQRIPVIYFQYEQPVAMLRPRLWSCVTGEPTQMFAATPFNALSKDVRGKLAEFEYIDDYLLMMDMQSGVNGSGGAAELVATMHRVCGGGAFRPQLVCVDWLGCMVKRYCQANGLNEMRDAFMVYGNTLTALRYEVANAFNCEVFLTHQLNAAANTKGVGARASMYDASEYRNISHLADTCIVIGATGSNGIARVSVGKNRGVSREVVVRVHGSECRFEVLEGTYVTIRDASGREMLVNSNGVGADGDAADDDGFD